jgi:hypothetical protein
MKFLLLLLAIALPIGYLFGEEEYARLASLQEISRAPGFAPAVVEEVLKVESKRHASYRVRFKYEVNGQQFHVTTTSTDQEGALKYTTQKNMQVAYSTRNPSVSTLRRYYDLRNPQETMPKALAVTSALALMLALPIALLVGWRLGWFRRSTA